MKRRRRTPAVDPALLEIFAAANAMTASGQEPRKHHLVPRFYLDRWAESGRVMVTDLDAHKSHQVDPKNALIETDFYRVPPGTVIGSESPVVWEAMLSTVEGAAAAVFDKLDRLGYLSLDSNDLGRLVEFVAVQITRSRWHRYQGRWMSGVGLYRQFELDRPGAIEHALRESGEDPTPERIAEVEAFWARIIKDPWQMVLPAALEMALAQRSAIALADLLAERWCVVYETARPIVTCDEPVVSLWEFMGADHVLDGGYSGTPIVIFPLGPHQVLAMFRNNMPVVRRIDTPLDWRETLDLNQVIAGNAYRHVVSQPSNPIANKLRIPESKEPTQFQNLGTDENGGELVRSRIIRRWSDEAAAPVRPVASWWPPIIPAAPRPPRSNEDWEEEYRKWRET